MIKVNQNEFHLFSFIIKTVIVLLSLAVSLFVCFFFEQKGMVAQLQTTQLQTTQLQAESAIPSLNVKLTGKDFERILSGFMPMLILTRSSLLTFVKFFTFFYAGILLLAKCIMRCFTKKSVVTLQNNQAPVSFKASKSEAVPLYDTIENLNLTLNI